jgi:hypothetical protein
MGSATVATKARLVSTLGDKGVDTDFQFIAPKKVLPQ